jgi:putative tricarboxylic transport membrane protein
MTRADRIWGMVILLFGGVYLVEGIRIPPAAIGDPLGPRTFPTVLGVVLLVCGAILLCRPQRRKAAVIERKLFVPVMLLAGLLVAYALSLAWLGYPLATFLFMIIAARMMGERSLAWSLPIAGGFSVGIYLVFTRLLMIPLPPGLLAMVGLG